jgi:uncharacterized protein with GYD domain
MPHFMLKGKFSQESVKGLTANPQDRRKAAEVALAAAGAKLKDYYFALGDADVLVTYEAPDASVETIALLTTDEAMEAMKKSGKAQKAYKPPSGKAPNK